MIVTLRTERLGPIEQVAAFVEASEPVDFYPTERVDTCEFVKRTLVRLGYSGWDKPSKARVKRFLEKTTGYSRARG